MYYTTYKLVSGDKKAFEYAVNKLMSIKTEYWFFVGNLNTNITDKGVFYSQILGNNKEEINNK